MKSSTEPVVAREAAYRWIQRWQRCALTVIVADASVLATALGDDGADGDRARGRLRGGAAQRTGNGGSRGCLAGLAAGTRGPCR